MDVGDGRCHSIRGDTGGIPPETRREYVHVGFRLWLLLRSTSYIHVLGAPLPAGHSLWEYTPRIPAQFCGVFKM